MERDDEVVGAEDVDGLSGHFCGLIWNGSRRGTDSCVSILGSAVGVSLIMKE